MSHQPTLSQLQAHFDEQGWDRSYLDSFEMNMNAGAVEASQGDPQGGGDQGGDGGGQGDGSDGSEYSLAAGFLGRVPQEHRSIVEPYVKQWDAGVTRRFQELQSQLAPYQELGMDFEDLQSAASLAQMMQENPYQVYGILHQALINGELIDPATGQPIQQGAPMPGQQQQQAPIAGQQQDQGLGGQEIPAPVQARLDEMAATQQQLVQALTAMGQHFLGQQQTQQQQEEDAQLSSWLEGLHTEFGDFDENYVMMKVYQGESPEDAVNSFNELVTSRATSQLQKNSGIPTLLGGGGGAGAPADQGSVKSLNRNQTKDLVAEALKAAAQNRQ